MIAVHPTSTNVARETQSQLHQILDTICVLLLTREYIYTGIEIWDAGTSLSASSSTSLHVLKKVFGCSYVSYGKVLGI